MLRSLLKAGIFSIFSGRELRRLGGFCAVIALLHVTGWGMLILVVAPMYPASLSIGVGFTAYLFGLRHAFDADHISAIDNTTRKLMADGKQPLGVGFFFSLGHSAVVLTLAMVFAFAAQQIASQVTSDDSALRSVGGLVGTMISASFLYLIAFLNLVILINIVRVFVEMRQGRYDEKGLEEQLQTRGFMNRFFGQLSRAVGESWQMLSIGFLFGLGFETASEVALLAFASEAAANGLPLYAVICLPLIFAAGMTTMDTADGAFMSKAYGWAFSNPIRKIYYNITVTGLSVVVALLVGSIELLGILQQRMSLPGRFWGFIGNLDLGSIGYLIVGLFIITWLASYGVWKLGRIEERWQVAAPIADE
ncbi:MAG TPA: HoxN/HupN/NixA family nickel/cobalt transporter [Candidatus Saccharimonadales bacterium]|nr:HoxN/HupN/NixA family nickel/cobalt transporter [Candidatus Saccharimonadales bacterium]